MVNPLTFSCCNVHSLYPYLCGSCNRYLRSNGLIIDIPLLHTWYFGFPEWLCTRGVQTCIRITIGIPITMDRRRLIYQGLIWSRTNDIGSKIRHNCISKLNLVVSISLSCLFWSDAHIQLDSDVTCDHFLEVLFVWWQIDSATCVVHELVAVVTLKKLSEKLTWFYKHANILIANVGLVDKMVSWLELQVKVEVLWSARNRPGVQWQWDVYRLSLPVLENLWYHIGVLLGLESTYLITLLVIMPDLVRRNFHEMLNLGDGRADVILELHFPNHSIGAL